MQIKINSLLVSLAIHFLLVFVIFTIVDNIFPEIDKKSEERHSINLKNIFTEGNIENKIIVKKNLNENKKYIVKKINSKFKKNKKYTLEKLKPTSRIRASYGDTFDKLSRREQQYLLDNWSEINELNELFSPKIQKEDQNTLKIGDHETVIFYLNTDGTISDIVFTENNNTHLTEAIGKSIIQSYKYYKKPRVKTLMKIRVDIKVPFK